MSLFTSDRQLPSTSYVVVDIESHGLAAKTTADSIVYFVCTLTVEDDRKPLLKTWWCVDNVVEYLNQQAQKGFCLVYHNSKFDHAALTLRGLRVPIAQVLDTQVLAYLEDNQRREYNLDALTGQKQDLLLELQESNLIAADMTKDDFWNTDHSDDTEVLQKLVNYCKQDVKATYNLYKALVDCLSDRPSVVAAYFTLDQPMLEVLINLESHGALIDTDALLSLLSHTQEQVNSLEATIRESVGSCPQLKFVGETYVPVEKEYKSGVYKNKLHVPPFYTDNHGIFVRQWEGHKDNGEDLVVGSHCPLIPFNSAAATGHVWWVINKQCPEVLDSVKSTKSGKPQINKDFISDISEQLPESFPVGKLAKAVKANQMATTISINLADDNHIRCDFAHTRTLTGRLATSNPNLQNLPRAGKDEDSQRFRKLFIASPGNVLLCADLDQIELRVLAYYLLAGEKDTGLADEFNGADPDAHTRNAKAWGVERNVAKTLIFLLVYGGQPKLMVERKLFKTLAEAEAAFNGVKENQPSINKLMQKVVANSAKKGYVRTLAGRYLYYPNLTSADKWERMRAERQCFNALIQGSARDIMHKLVVESLPEIKRAGANLVNIVHDECLVEVSADKAEALKKALNCIWEQRKDLLVGVTVNGSWNTGSTWYEAK